MLLRPEATPRALSEGYSGETPDTTTLLTGIRCNHGLE